MRLEEGVQTFFLKEEHINLLKECAKSHVLTSEAATALEIILDTSSFVPGLYEHTNSGWAKIENMY